MDLTVTVILCVSVIIAQASVSSGSRKVDDKQFARFVSRSGLRLDPDLRDTVLQRLVRQERWTVGGGLIALVISWVAAFSTGWTLGPAVVWLASAVGCGIGGGLAVLRQRSQLPAGTSRVARSRHTALSDYITTGELRTTRWAPIAAVISALVVTVSLLFVRLPESSSATMLAMWVPVVLALVGLGGFELFSRIIVDRPQPVASDDELAWDDLAKARGIRGLMSSSLVLSYSAMFWTVLSLALLITPSATRLGQEQVTMVLGVLGLLMGVVLLLVSVIPLIMALPRSRFHVLERLWMNATVAPR